MLSPDLEQVFLPLEEKGQADGAVCYEPRLLAMGTVSFVDKKRGVDREERKILLAAAPDADEPVGWQEAAAISLATRDLLRAPVENATFRPVPKAINTPRKVKRAAKAFSDHLYRTCRLVLFQHPGFKIYSFPGESLEGFLLQCQTEARERRDAELDKLEATFEKKLDRLGRRLSREKRELAEDHAEYESRKSEEVFSAGESLLGMFLGRRNRRILSSAARKRRMTARAKAEIAESEEEIRALLKERDKIREELEDACDRIRDRWSSAAEETEEYLVRPRRADVAVDFVAIAWVPQEGGVAGSP